MSPIDILIALFFLVAGALLTAAYGAISMSPADFYKARSCFYGSALFIGVAAVLWGFTNIQPTWARYVVMAVVGSITAVGLTEGLRWLGGRESMLKPDEAVTSASKASPSPERTKLSQLPVGRTPIALRLQFRGGDTVPIGLRSDNVLFWYALWGAEARASFLDEKKVNVGGMMLPKTWTIFLLFDEPSAFRQIIVQPASSNFPPYEVNYASQYMAIVTTRSDIPAGILDIYSFQ